MSSDICALSWADQMELEDNAELTNVNITKAEMTCDTLLDESVVKNIQNIEKCRTYQNVFDPERPCNHGMNCKITNYNHHIMFSHPFAIYSKFISMIRSGECIHGINCSRSDCKYSHPDKQIDSNKKKVNFLI